MDLVSSSQILHEVKDCARIIKDPTGQPVAVISESDSLEIAHKSGCLLRNVYTTALAADIWPYRYLRNRSTLTSNDQCKLAESTVAIIGCGGLGGYVVLMLARIGIGLMTVADPDSFDETNLNRQAFAISETIGMPKTDAVFSAVKSVNPAIHIEKYQTALSYSNSSQILDGADVVVDALDNLPAREMLLQETRRMKIPLVHGAIAGFEGQVMTYDPGVGQHIDIFKNVDKKASEDNPSAEAILGVPSITPAYVASLQAMEVVKVLLKRGKPFRNRILYSDLESGEFNYFDFNA